MVGGDHDQCVVRRCHLHRGLHRIAHCDGVGERAVGVAFVVGVVDAAAFHQQHVTVGIALQARDRRAGHLGEARLTCAIGRAVVFVLHVAQLEQAQQRCIGRGSGELLGIPRVAPPG